MSEETIFDQNEVKEEKQGGEPMNDEETALIERTNPSAKAPKGKKKKDYKTAGIAGAAGVAGVATGVLTPVNVFPDALSDGDGVTDDLEPEPVPSTSGHLQGHDMDVATGVDDSMSFSQAFAAARHEVGPGGLFVWHGNTYGTYYANEWNAMSPEEHDQYWADVHHTTENIVNEPAESTEPVEPTEPIEPTEPTEPAEPTEPIEPAESTEPVEPIDPIEPIEPIDLDEPIATIDPEPLTLAEEDVIAEYDLDGNGTADVAIVDVNDNDIADVIVDTTGDGNYDTLVIDPEVDDNGELIVAEDNIVDIGGVEMEDGSTLVMDGDELDSMDGTMEDNPYIDASDEETYAENPDVDDLASFESDPNVTIDNNIDMSDFV